MPPRPPPPQQISFSLHPFNQYRMYIVFKSIVLHFAFSSFVVQSLPWSLIRPQLTASITRAGPYTHSTSSLTEAAPGNLTNAATISSLEGLVGGSFGKFLICETPNSTHSVPFIPLTLFFRAELQQFTFARKCC